MENLISCLVLFLAKVLSNAFGTTKTILIQRSRWILAGMCVGLSDFIYYQIMKSVVTDTGSLQILIVSIAGGVGCTLACMACDYLSKDRTYVNVIMCDDIDAMKGLRDFLAAHHITNVASDSYTKDWNRKTITITAYAETKDQSRLINEYIEYSPLKFKRLIQKG